MSHTQETIKQLEAAALKGLFLKSQLLISSQQEIHTL